MGFWVNLDGRDWTNGWVGHTPETNTRAPEVLLRKGTLASSKKELINCESKLNV